MQKIYLNIKQLYFFQEFCIEINWYMYIYTSIKNNITFFEKTTTDNTKYQFFFLYLQQNANTLHD